MALGLIWLNISSVSFEVMLASSFWQEREREIERLWHFLQWRLPESDASLQLGTSRSRWWSKSLGSRPCSFFSYPWLSFSLPFSFIFLFFLFCCEFFLSFLSMKDCCFGCFLTGTVVILFFFGFLIANSSEKVGPASLYKWKTVVPLVAPLSRHFGSSSERLEGFSFFKVQIFRPCSRSYF